MVARFFYFGYISKIMYMYIHTQESILESKTMYSQLHWVETHY